MNLGIMRLVRGFIGLTITWPIQNIYHMFVNSVSILRNLIFSEAHDILYKKSHENRGCQKSALFGNIQIGGHKMSKIDNSV